MMVYRPQHGFPRGIALFTVLLFTALSLLASGPHPIDRATGAATERAAFGLAHDQADGACPLCDWLAHSVAVVSASPKVVLHVGIQALRSTPDAKFHLAPTVRRPTGRAPPLRFM